MPQHNWEDSRVVLPGDTIRIPVPGSPSITTQATLLSMYGSAPLQQYINLTNYSNSAASRDQVIGMNQDVIEAAMRDARNLFERLTRPADLRRALLQSKPEYKFPE